MICFCYLSGLATVTVGLAAEETFKIGNPDCAVDATDGSVL